MRAIFVSGLILLTAATAPAQRFDLECADSGGNDGPYTAHYRIDLASRKWCEDQCRTVKPIAGVQASYITLESEPNSDWWHTIDREKGEDQIFSQINGIEHISGSCTRKAFSGFAKFKTKF